MPRKGGGVIIEMDRPEIYLREVRDKDGKIIEETCRIKEVAEVEPEPLKKAPNEPICKHRGEVTKTESCCGGKTRPTEIECKHEELPDRVPFVGCNSIYCKFYEAS